MTTTDTAASLRFVAQLIDGFPGLPPVAVWMPDARNISIQVYPSDADDNARAVAVDMLLAVLGSRAAYVEATGSYAGVALVDGRTVTVYAPQCQVVTMAGAL